MDITPKTIESLGAFAILGASFLLILRWMLGRFEAHMRAMDDTLKVQVAALIELQKQFLAHDLTVSGLNPSAGHDIDERTNKAHMKYSEIQDSLSEIKRAVLASR